MVIAGAARRLPGPDHPAARRRTQPGRRRCRGRPRRRALAGTRRCCRPARDALHQPAAQRPGRGHHRAHAEHPGRALREAGRAAGGQLCHRPEHGGRAQRRPAQRAGNLPDPAADHARLPSVLPLHDPAGRRWRLDCAQPLAGTAARAGVRDARRQGDGAVGQPRYRLPLAGDRPLRRIRPRPARVPGLAANGQLAGLLQRAGRFPRWGPGRVLQLVPGLSLAIRLHRPAAHLQLVPAGQPGQHQ